MASVKLVVRAKKLEKAPVYIRIISGRTVDIWANTLLSVNPGKWSNKKQNFKHRDITEDETKLIGKLKKLKSHVETEVLNRFEDISQVWLEYIINKFHNIKDSEAKTLNQYISKFITEAETGIKKNKSSMDFAPGTVRIFKGFQLIFNEYQGVYTEKRKAKRIEAGKKLRTKKIEIDFDDINDSFYNSFVNFLTEEEYARNTMGRFVKSLKIIMKKALKEELHNNTKFSDFEILTEGSHAIYLTNAELDKIYQYDLSKENRLDLARDTFIILCETALRISDYKKISVNIRTIDKKKFIDVSQTKTGTKVIIPLTPRFQAIWEKHGNKLPYIPEQYVNEFIKSICFRCGITDKVKWETAKFGKKFETEKEKYKLVTCHTARRTACSNMYLAGIPLKDIREISGHSSDKQLLEYIRVTKEQTAVKLSDHEYFNRPVLKIAK